MESMLICLINQKSARSVIIGIFLDKSFSYGPYLCDGCYNMMQKCNKLKILLLFILKKMYTEFVLCL